MHTTTLLLLALSAAVTKSHSVRDHVDLVEVNHYHDESGRHVFDQLIFYDWNASRNRFEVRTWRLIKQPHQLPRHVHGENVWRVHWHDAGVLRSVDATSHRETWTQYDPELANRAILPQELRRDLTNIPESIPRLDITTSR